MGKLKHCVVLNGIAILASVLVGCSFTPRATEGGMMMDVPAPATEGPLTPEEVKLGTAARVEAATVALASDQHVFRFDGELSRTFSACEGTVCAVSATPDGLDGALARARSDPRFDFGTSHFGARLEDSLDLKPHDEPGRVSLVEGFGLRAGERAFSAKFYGGWLDDGAFFVNRATLTVRDARGQPIGLGTVFDASAVGVANATAPATVEGMSGRWTGMMIGVDVSDEVTRGQFLQGDAILNIDNFANPAVDIEFSNFRDLETGALLATRSIAAWEDIPVTGGEFGAKPVGSSDYIQGRFVGDNHAGALGVFERADVVGSFGASRQPVQ